MKTQRSVLVVGARGVLGGLVADAFESAGWTVRRGSRQPDGAAGERPVDLDRRETIAAALDGVDLAVNAVPHAHMAAEREALEHGGVVLTVASPTEEAVRSLRQDVEAPRGTAVVHGGLAPGVTNLVAADLVARHPGVDTVEIALTFSASGANGRAGREFTHRGLTAVRRHRTAQIPFPKPYGVRRCVEFSEADRGWLGGLAQGRTVRTYLCFGERPVHAAVLALNQVGAIGLMTRTAVALPAGGAQKPSDEPVREWVAVSRDGERIAARSIHASGDYSSTAAATVVLADALLERDGGPPAGCFTPEELLTLADVEDRLRAVGIEIFEEPVAPGSTSRAHQLAG